MTGRDAVLLVARREIVERARDRSFLISTGIVLVMIALFTLGPRLLGLGGPDDYTVGTVGAGSEALAGAVAERAPAADAEVTLEGLADDEAARAAVRDGDVDVAILDGERLLVDSELPGGLEALLQESSEQLRVSERLTEAGVPAQDVGAVLAPEPLAVEALNPPEDRGDRDAASGLAFFTVFILYGQLFGYGMWVAMGVVEEKSTRVVEVLLATISPTHLLAGKVIGIGLLGLAQLTLIATLGVGIVLLTGATQLPPSAPAAIATALGWYVLGYAFYACAFAMCGALVSRQEELQNAITPLTLSIFASLFLAFVALSAPGGMVARIASFVPPVAPMVMPVRVTLGEVAAWEVAASVAVMLASIGGMVLLAGRVYQGAILRTGARVKIRDALRAR